MNLKKNAVSYVTWMIVLLFTGASFAFLGMVTAQLSNINILFAAAGCIVVFFGVLYMVYSMTGYVVSMQINKISIPFLEKHGVLAEILFLAVATLIAAGIRVYLLPTAGEEAAYFEVSKVTDQSSILVQSVQGSVYYYCMLLHLLFLLVGNHWIAGIWMQIVLQLAGGLLLYFALKKLLGKCPAVLAYAYILYAPSAIKAGLTYSPQILYFCVFSLVLFLLGDYLKRSLKVEEYPVAMWIYTAVIGILIGVCTYIDITGCLLFCMIFYMLMLKREYHEPKKWLMRTGLMIITAMIGFLALILVDSILSGTSFGRVLNAWFVTYGSFNTDLGIITDEATIDLFVIMLLISLGVFSFWRRKKEERFTPFVFMCLGIALMQVCGITTENMNGSYLLYILFVILATICVTELFCGEEKMSDMKATEIPIKDINLESDIKKEENTAEAKPRLIESPLPLPKKHVKKNMDYAINPQAIDMKYDVLVSDSDDFDI